MITDTETDIPTLMALVEQRLGRAEADIMSLSTAVQILSDKVERGFSQINEKLESSHTRWIESFTTHVKADSDADKAIIEKIASTHAWVRGIGVGAGIIFPLLTWLVSSGLLQHV